MRNHTLDYDLDKLFTLKTVLCNIQYLNKFVSRMSCDPYFHHPIPSYVFLRNGTWSWPSRFPLSRFRPIRLDRKKQSLCPFSKISWFSIGQSADDLVSKWCSIICSCSSMENVNPVRLSKKCNHNKITLINHYERSWERKLSKHICFFRLCLSGL